MSFCYVVLIRCFCKFVFADFLTDGCMLKCCNVWQQNVYKQYTDHILCIFCLHLTQFILLTYYVCKLITIPLLGRQFEFPEAKVVKLGVEHYDYNTNCGNNNAFSCDTQNMVHSYLLATFCLLKSYKTLTKLLVC